MLEDGRLQASLGKLAKPRRLVGRKKRRKDPYADPWISLSISFKSWINNAYMDLHFSFSATMSSLWTLCGYIFILLLVVPLPTHHHTPPTYTHECAAISQALWLPHCLACTCASSHPCCVYWLLGYRNLARNYNCFPTPGGPWLLTCSPSRKMLALMVPIQEK